MSAGYNKYIFSSLVFVIGAQNEKKLFLYDLKLHILVF